MIPAIRSEVAIGRRMNGSEMLMGQLFGCAVLGPVAPL